MASHPDTQLNRPVSMDIELTNACNATCTFCPRDNMPSIGSMKPEIFRRAVERGFEYHPDPLFRFCGTGDALMNKHIVEYARYITQRGGRICISTNGHLLNRDKAQALIDAGIHRLTFSISSRGERYNEEFGLDYDITLRNIVNFIELARDKCQVRVAMVLHDPGTPYAEDEAYWRSLGIGQFIKYDLINRAGALFPVPELSEGQVSTPRAQLKAAGEYPVCMTPFQFLFVGWDGHYYLCSSDWRKQSPVGHVEQQSVEETMAARLQAVQSRGPICAACSNDPVNRLCRSSNEASEAAGETDIVLLVGEA